MVRHVVGFPTHVNGEQGTFGWEEFHMPRFTNYDTRAALGALSHGTEIGASRLFFAQ